MKVGQQLPEVKALSQAFLRPVCRVLEADFEAGRSALGGRGLALDPVPHPQPYGSDGLPLSIANTVGDPNTPPNRS